MQGTPLCLLHGESDRFLPRQGRQRHKKTRNFYSQPILHQGGTPFFVGVYVYCIDKSVDVKVHCDRMLYMDIVMGMMPPRC